MARRAVWKKVGKNYAATAAAFCTRTPVSPVDRQLGRAQQKWIAKQIRPLFCFSGLLGVQRSGGQRHLAQSRLGIAAVYRRGQPHTVGDRHRH